MVSGCQIHILIACSIHLTALGTKRTYLLSSEPESSVCPSSLQLNAFTHLSRVSAHDFSPWNLPIVSLLVVSKYLDTIESLPHGPVAM